jgi:hypothetical protein
VITFLLIEVVGPSFLTLWWDVLSVNITEYVGTLRMSFLSSHLIQKVPFYDHDLKKKVAELLLPTNWNMSKLTSAIVHYTN